MAQKLLSALHIATAGTFTPVDRSCYLFQVVITCRAPGTAFKIKVTDRGDSLTPTQPFKTIVPEFTLALTDNGEPNLKEEFKDLAPVLMSGGIDVITSGTPGIADVWLGYWAPEF